VVITNSSGDALERYHYYPFGRISEETGSLANTHKFTGKELDSIPCGQEGLLRGL